MRTNISHIANVTYSFEFISDFSTSAFVTVKVQEAYYG